jgi:GTPase SAR1 family protein
MRRRTAFHAESDTDYIAKVKDSDMINTLPKALVSGISVYANTEKVQELICQVSQPATTERSPSFHAPNNKFLVPKVYGRDSISFENFTFAQSRKSSSKSFSSRKSSETDETAQCESPLTSVRLIMLADSQVQNNSFVSYLFNEEQEPSCMKNPLDLKVRTYETAQSTVKYHMWMKSCNDENATEKLKSLFMIYYRTVSSFVFLYSVENRESFLCVKHAVKTLLKDIGTEKLKGILVGIKNDNTLSSDQGQTRAVTVIEAEELKEEAGLSEFMEIDYAEHSQREVILNLLENFKKESLKASSELQH